MEKRKEVTAKTFGEEFKFCSEAGAHAARFSLTFLGKELWGRLRRPFGVEYKSFRRRISRAEFYCSEQGEMLPVLLIRFYGQNFGKIVRGGTFEEELLGIISEEFLEKSFWRRAFGEELPGENFGENLKICSEAGEMLPF